MSNPPGAKSPFYCYFLTPFPKQTKEWKTFSVGHPQKLTEPKQLCRLLVKNVVCSLKVFAESRLPSSLFNHEKSSYVTGIVCLIICPAVCQWLKDLNMN